jgi:hypothetical protein
MRRNKYTIMKKILTLLILLLSFSCANNQDTGIQPIIVVDIIPKKIDIIITTTEPIFDEIVLSYKDFNLEEEWVYGPRQFEYDSNGNPLPIIVSFEEYKYATIVGNAYRNNDLPSGLKAQLFINDTLVLEDEAFGSDGVYATVNFDYDIEN